MPTFLLLFGFSVLLLNPYDLRRCIEAPPSVGFAEEFYSSKESYWTKFVLLEA